MKNQFNYGKIFDGKKSSKATITYNDKTLSLTEWINLLETRETTLRAKVLRATHGEISWDVAMADKAMRYKFQIDRKRERRQKMSKKKLASIIRKEEKRGINEQLIRLTNIFLYTKLISS